MASLLLCSLSCSRSKNDSYDIAKDVILPEGMAQFTLPQLINGNETTDTRTVYSDEKGKLVWSENDTIGVFPQAGSSIYFSMSDFAGDDVAKFNGGGWQLKPSTVYYSYYPFVPDMYMKADAVPYTTIGQVQAKNAVRNHDGFDCLWARKETASNNSVNFEFTRLCCFLKFVFTPGEGTYTKLVLSSDEAVIPVKGTYDLTASNPSIRVSSDGYAKSLEMKINNIELAAEQQLILYMAFIPCDLSGHEITITLENSEGRGFEFKKSFSKPMLAGTLYNINIGTLSQNLQYYFKNRTAIGMYNLESASEVCTYTSGTDMYSHMSMPGYEIVRVMNPSSNDDVYKFLEMKLKKAGADWADGASIELLAPSLSTFDGRTYNVELVQQDDHGRMWLYNESEAMGFIAKFE